MGSQFEDLPFILQGKDGCRKLHSSQSDFSHPHTLMEQEAKLRAERSLGGLYTSRPAPNDPFPLVRLLLLRDK